MPGRNPQRATIIDVARHAGVSKSTVSLVLQGSLSVSAESRKRVAAAISELGYIYNQGAASLKRRRSRSIGLVIHDLTNSYFAELAIGTDMVMQSAGFVQLMAHTEESIERQSQVIATMREYGIAGLILSPVRLTDPTELTALAQAGVPVVLVGRSISGARVSSLVADNVGGAEAAVRHLIERGHRRIAFLGGYREIANFGDRLEGYRRALTDAGISYDEALVFPTNGGRAGGVLAVERLSSAGWPADAALCFNDAVAFGVYDGLRVSGKEPGRDFSVIGFDDVMEARAAMPALTTISTDPQGMGRRAAQLLLRQINTRSATPESIICPARLIIRAS